MPRYDKLTGKMELGKTPSNWCWTTPKAFAEELINSLQFSWPFEDTHKAVIYGDKTPSADDKDKMWARFDNSGNWLGWYAWQKGSWKRVYNYRSDQVIWLYGNSNNIPDGFQLLDGTAAGAPDLSPQFTANQSGGYSYYAVRWIGY